MYHLSLPAIFFDTVISLKAMTTVQQQTNGTFPGPPFGRDISGRMKLPERRRQSLPASPLQKSISANQLTQSQSTSSQPTSRPTLATHRAITAPSLKLRTAYAGTDGATSPPNNESKQNGEHAEPSSDSICRSPTWSRSTSQKQKKADRKKEKERKEMEKRMRKEEQKKAPEEKRTGRRLSKRPPPAAMETQRMAASLTWPPVDDESRSTSRASSRPASRRSSAGSLSSIMRLPFLRRRNSSTSRKDSSTLSESPIEFTDDGPPQLEPPIGLGSRSSFNSRGSDSDDAYVKDLMDFAYQVDEPSREALGTETPNSDNKKRPTSLAPLSSNPPGGSPKLGSPGSSTPNRNIAGAFPTEAGQKEETERNESQARHAEKKDSSKRHSFTKFLRSEPRKIKADAEPLKAPTDVFQSFPYTKSTSSPNILHDARKVGNQGGSNIRKQGMFQQQRSMANYRDKLVVQSANDLLSTGNHRWPLRLDNSVDSLPSEDRNGSADSSIPGIKTVDGVADPKTDSTALGKDVRDARARSSIEKVSEDQPHFPERQTLKPDVKETSTPTRTSVTAKLLGPHATESPKPVQPSTQPQRPRRLQEGSSFPTEIPVPARSPGRKFNLASSKEPVAGPSQLPQSGSENGSVSSSVSFELPRISRSSTDQPLPLIVKSVPVAPSTSKTDGSEMANATGQSTKGKELMNPHGQKQEMIVEGVNGEGLVRQTSLRRPRSDPELNAAIEKVKSPSLDFLPELKHQPLVRPKRTSARVSFKTEEEIVPPPSTLHLPTTTPGSTMLDFTTPPPPPSLTTALQTLPKPGIPMLAQTQANGTRRQSAFRSAVPGSSRASFAGSTPQLMQPVQTGPPAAEQALHAKPVAKLFVICCKCNFWHDLPSRLYEAMAAPQSMAREQDPIVDGMVGKSGSGSGSGAGAGGGGGGGVGGWGGGRGTRSFGRRRRWLRRRWKGRTCWRGR